MLKCLTKIKFLRLSLTIGMPEPMPGNSTERIFATIISIIAICVIACIIASLSSIVLMFEQESGANQKYLRQVMTFLKRKEVPMHLRRRVNAFVETSFAYSGTKVRTVQDLNCLTVE